MREVDRLRDLLRALLPDQDPIHGVSPLTTGFSNETYRIDGPDLILRLPPSAGAMLDGHDVVTQARIYAALGEMPGAPPVPAIVAIGEDPAVLGAPFFVMERIAGESIDDLTIPLWLIEGTDDFRRRVCTDWVATFARLATMPPLPVLGPAITPEKDMHRWRSFAQIAGNDSLCALFDRLLAVPAPCSGAPAIIHGDVKLSNLMWHDGRISAVLDWEMALNGDPLADLGYMLYFFESAHHVAARAQKLPGMLSRTEAIALWCRVSGRSADGVWWHEIAQSGKIAAIISEGANMHDTGRSSDPKLIQFKAMLGYYVGVMAAMLDEAGL